MKHSPPRRTSRFLKVAATVAVAGFALTACSATASDSDSAPADNTLTVGVNAGGTDTVLEPHARYEAFNSIWATSFFESLGTIGDDGEYVDVLAESFTPNEDGSVWTAKLRDGVTFHDGKELSADDVIFTFNRIKDPATGATSLTAASAIEKMTKIDDKTVEFDLVSPVGVFPETLADGGAGIIEETYDPEHPVSTGPWKFESYDPGRSIKVSRYDDYWGEPAKLDGVEFVGIPDNDARMNALTTGQIDVNFAINAAQIPLVEGDKNLKVVNIPSGYAEVITMRVDEGPTADVKVRQAIKMAVDRDEVMTVLDGGNSRLGNDLLGIDDPAYRDDLVVKRDVEGAKALIKEAGAEGAAITLTTLASIEPLAQIVAKNAQEIGLNVTVDLKDDATYYSEGYLQYQMGVDPWPGIPIIASSGLTNVPTGSLNYTHFDDPEYTALYETAKSTLDDAVREDALGKMQEIQFERGGFLIPRFVNTLAVVPANTTGWPEADVRGYGISTALANVSFTK